VFLLIFCKKEDKNTGISGKEIGDLVTSVSDLPPCTYVSRSEKIVADRYKFHV